MNEWCTTFQIQSDIANLVELGLIFMYSTYFTYSPFDSIYICDYDTTLKRQPWKTQGN